MSVPSPLAKALRASEQHYRNLFENASDIIFTCDLAGRFTSLNKAGERITGYTRGEASQMSLLQVVAPEKHELARYALERAAKGETPPLGEWEIVPKDRRRVLLEVSIQPIYQNGKPEAVQGIARDVTERRRMEEALRESEGRNRDLVEHSQDLMCTHDLTGKLLSVNSAPAKMLGYTPEELLKIPMRDLLAPEVRKDFDVYLETIRREGTAQGLMVVQTRTGERRIWEYGNTLRTAGVAGPIVRGMARDITERHEAERRLRESERRYRLLAENVSDVIWTMDLGLRYTYISPSVVRLRGVSVQEAMAEDFEATLTPNCASLARRTLAEELSKDASPSPNLFRSRKLELEQLRKDGSTVWTEVTATFLRDKNGKPTGILGITRDINQRMVADEALRTSEASYRELFENANDAIATFDLKGRFTSLNRSAQAMLGYPREKAIEMTFMQVTPERDHERLGQQVQLINAGKTPPMQETEVIDKDGRRHTVEFRARPVLHDGKPISLQVIARDITERRRAEQTLLEYEKVVEGSQDMIAVVDREYRYVVANRAFLHQRDMEREQVVGRRAPEVLGQAYFEQWVKSQLDESFQGKALQYELRCSYPGMGERDLRASYFPIEGAAGVDRVACILQDITESKHAEEERMHLEEQLRQAQKMEAVGRLAGGVAHDFNNLLVVINGYAELVLRNLSPRHPVRQRLNEIRKAGEQAARLTGQLLSFSRSQIVVPEIFHLNTVVSYTKEMLRRVIGEDVKLVIRRAHRLPKVLADPGQIAQAVVNLAANARDAMPAGGRLTIETDSVELPDALCGDLPGAAPGRYVTLAVSDTGVGMSKEVMEHMFEPFFTTKEKGRGTGLGLSMVYGIVQQSGGYIRARSDPGHGSAFVIYLPSSRAGSGKPAARPTRARLARGRGTVLVVEDELAVRQVVATAVRSSGYKVLEACSGEEAMHRLRRHDGPLHLLLTDLVMPGMNGQEVADRVRTLHPEVKVLFMSGYAGDALMRRGMSGAQGSFLQKPFTIEGLTKKVQDALKAL